jgi:ssDNA-binding replication factor A large subunit
MHFAAMKESIPVRVIDIIGNTICVSADDGQRLHDKIKPLLDQGNQIVLSFEGVETLIATFLNASIGQLYGTLSEEKIRQCLSVQGLAPDDLEVLKRVVENAIAYFSRPKQYDQAWKNEVGGEAASL